MTTRSRIPSCIKLVEEHAADADDRAMLDHARAALILSKAIRPRHTPPVPDFRRRPGRAAGSDGRTPALRFGVSADAASIHDREWRPFVVPAARVARVEASERRALARLGPLAPITIRRGEGVIAVSLHKRGDQDWQESPTVIPALMGGVDGWGD